MTGPPGVRPVRGAPGARMIQARTDGQRVEVRTFEGELIGKLNSAAAESLVAGGLGDRVGQGHVRLKLGIRWMPLRNNQVGGCLQVKKMAGHPDLNNMRDKDPRRYATNWRGNSEARIGKGALGQQGQLDNRISYGGRLVARIDGPPTPRTLREL